MAGKRLGLSFGLKQLTKLAAPRPRALTRTAQVKSLLPAGAYNAGVYEFFSADGGKTMIDLSGQHTVIALAAYWYVATRWRAQKIAEAPLMVVAEDQETGNEEWLSEHELSPMLDAPALDYDMGELLDLTSRYLDCDAEMIWVIDRDRVGTPARLTPFRRGEFTVERSADRLFDTFHVNTMAGGREDFPAEDVCYFRESLEGWTQQGIARSRLDVAMKWLQLSERARVTVRDLLTNAIWPSGVIIPDKDWNPSPETLEQYKADIQDYAAPGQQGRPFVQLGGGTFEALTARIRDLVPTEIFNRVESVVSAVSGVPAIVLQFQVGMENSPWSQMAQARRMAYDDVIQPAWRKIERVITRQLLRPIDEDLTHFIRFDRTGVAALAEDRAALVATATAMGRAATLNERRAVMGLEPSKDPAADEIPELSNPNPLGLLPNIPPGQEDTPAGKARRALQRKARLHGLHAAFRHEATPSWQIAVRPVLAHDALAIGALIRKHLEDLPPEGKSLQVKDRGRQNVITAVVGFLKTESEPRWAKATQPLIQQASDRATAVIAADLSISFNLLHPGAVSFVKREAGQLISSISDTTRDRVVGALTRGLEAGDSVRKIAQDIEAGSAFGADRALLIARTETTRIFNGAPHDALAELSASSGRQFTKTWSGALDDRERDEHVALEGETVPISQTFSNGLDFPSEPNCRCAAIFNESEAA